MSFRSDAHLLLGSEPTPPEVGAWQHPDYPDSFTVAIDTDDRTGHIALTGNPSQLIELLARMTQAVTHVATAAGQLPKGQEPTQPAERATTGNQPSQGGLALSPGRHLDPAASGPSSRRHSEHPARTPEARP